MKKILLATTLLFIASLLWSQEIEKITYEIDGKTKTVNAVLAGVVQTRIYIYGQYSNTWIITEKSYRFIDENGVLGDWEEWETFSESPYAYANNDTLSELLKAITSKKYTETAYNNQKMLLVINKNKNNQDYWFEDKKYANFTQLIYIIVNE